MPVTMNHNRFQTFSSKRVSICSSHGDLSELVNMFLDHQGTPSSCNILTLLLENPGHHILKLMLIRSSSPRKYWICQLYLPPKDTDDPVSNRQLNKQILMFATAKNGVKCGSQYTRQQSCHMLPFNFFDTSLCYNCIS